VRDVVRDVLGLLEPLDDADHHVARRFSEPHVCPFSEGLYKENDLKKSASRSKLFLSNAQMKFRIQTYPNFLLSSTNR
jgi:hypothetical protein